jgi:hypothetical protein
MKIQRLLKNNPRLIEEKDAIEIYKRAASPNPSEGGA